MHRNAQKTRRKSVKVTKKKSVAVACEIVKELWRKFLFGLFVREVTESRASLHGSNSVPDIWTVAKQPKHDEHHVRR